jgi:Fic family protein
MPTGSDPRASTLTAGTDANVGDAEPVHDEELAISYEELPWQAQELGDGGAMSRRARLKARGPYKAAILPEIAEHLFRLPADVLAEAEDALVEIVRFDAELSATRFGRDEFAPLAAVLLRTESASSSQIENVTAGAKALAMATIHEGAGANAQLVAANVTAMQRAIAMSDELSISTILAAHAALMQGQDEALPGQFRQSQVWIGSNAPTPHTASFVPPHHSRVLPAMQDLITFFDRTDLPVLAHAAIAHAQFETIHPFADGNGRTGRALVHVLLKRAGTTRRITVPVSAGLLSDTSAYFQALTSYREGDAASIVSRFATATFLAVTNGRTLNSDIADIFANWEHNLTARRDSAAWRALPYLLRQPAVTIKAIEDAAGVSNPAAARAVERLEKGGILTPAGSGSRNRVWLATDVLDALDAFAARAGRRG